MTNIKQKNDKVLREALKNISTELYQRYQVLWDFACENYLTFMNVENLTDHGEQHVLNVEENVFNLLTPESIKKLSAFDLFCLLSACCLHDIGMIVRKTAREGYLKVRKDHHIRTRKLLTSEYNRFGLNIQEAKIIGEICYGHGISDLDELEVYDNWPIEPHGEVNTLFLTALLRIGDLTDLSYRRAPELVVALKNVQGESRRHWELHKKITGIKVDHKTCKITIAALADDEYDLPVLYNRRNWVKEELLLVKDIFRENGIMLDDVALHTNLHRSRVLSKENPFLRLESYGYEEHAAFFGRDKETEEIWEKSTGNKLLVLVGESGVGKTSLLNAGVRQRLIEDGRFVFKTRPSENFEDDLHKKIKVIFPKLRAKNIFSLLEKISSNGLDLVLFIDQFEEIFTIENKDGPATLKSKMLHFIGHVLSNEQSNVHLILGVREDFLAYLWEVSKEVPELYNRENTYWLKRFNRENAKQVIVNTIKHVKYSIEETLVKELLDDFIKEEGSENIYPPYIQIVCHKIFASHKVLQKKQKQNTTIALRTYEDLGRGTKIISDYFDEILNRFSPDERVVINEILAPMITYYHTKQRISYNEILKINNDRIEEINETLGKLVKNRIIKKIESERDEYELIHDFLAKKILANKATSRYSSHIKRAVEFIEDNYHKELTLQTLATELYLSREHLSRLFKSETERNFVDFLKETRIDAAKEIIQKDPRLKLNEMYKQVGFISGQTFTRTFKEVVGQTPSDYKKSLLEDNGGA